MGARLLGSRFGQAALVVALIGFIVGAYYIEPYAEMLVLLSSIVGSHDVVEDSVANERGDKVKTSTEASGGNQDPKRTVVRLSRAHHWFSTTLLEIEGYGFRWDAKWRNEDTLDLNIGFGCVERVSRPVTTVGDIRIFYNFAYNNKDLDLDLARSGRSDPGACRAVHHSDSRR